MGGTMTMDVSWAMLFLLWLVIAIFIIWAIASTIGARRQKR
jgi:hypothetical protein